MIGIVAAVLIVSSAIGTLIAVRRQTGGDVAIVGLAGGSLPVGFGTLPFEVRVTLTFWGTRAELAEVIALARAGRIRAHVERFRLKEVQQAYDSLRAGRLKGRAVVMPHEAAA